jgi:hypothetical protein
MTPYQQFIGGLHEYLQAGDRLEVHPNRLIRGVVVTLVSDVYGCDEAVPKHLIESAKNPHELGIYVIGHCYRSIMKMRHQARSTAT